MQAEQTAEEVGGVQVDEVAKAMGLTREEGRELAKHLEGIGWAKVQWSQVNADVRLWLTYDGLKMIAEWNLPRWRRWLQHPMTANVLALLALAIAATALVLQFFWRE